MSRSFGSLFWWPKQNHQVKASVQTPRKDKPLIHPNPQYQHNYGVGHSINYVPPDWHTYKFKHILQIIPLPRRMQLLVCTCGVSATARAHNPARIHESFVELWEKHVFAENELKAVFEVANAAIEDAIKKAEAELAARRPSPTRPRW